MPFTPIHLSIAYLAKAVNPRLSLPAFVVSTMVPDLENVFIFLVTGGQIDRLVLHSLLGAAILATLLSMMLTIFAYPKITVYLLNLDYNQVSAQSRFSKSLVAVCLLGVLSHVVIDSLHHEYNPLLFPFTTSSFDSLVFMNSCVASWIVPIPFIALLLFFVVKKLKKGTETFWTELLVE